MTCLPSPFGLWGLTLTREILPSRAALATHSQARSNLKPESKCISHLPVSTPWFRASSFTVWKLTGRPLANSFSQLSWRPVTSPVLGQWFRPSTAIQPTGLTPFSSSPNLYTREGPLLSSQASNSDLGVLLESNTIQGSMSAAMASAA
ncbi:hypothetical protein FQN60_006467 [Etheostoma spectabile]|uniref:Uncharacterized protein n=1 Tax=Etheostoma spectabile TaxID=54343 RepID=A0A5J5CQ91_9PERO|nr:hypothetical protein FQN60_006467 [Etheostoma spectabile]